MGRIFDTVRAFLDGEGNRHEVFEGATALRFGFKTGTAQWTCVIEVREAQDLIIVASLLPGAVAVAHRPAVTETMMRINHVLSVGNFDMDLDTGTQRFRTSVDLEGSEVGPAIVKQLLHANLSTVARYIGALERVAAGAVPTEALAAVA